MTEPSGQEAQKKLARTLLEQGVSIEEAMAKSGLSKPACQGLKGVLVKAQKRLIQASKPAHKRLEPTEANSEPETEFQAEDEPNIDLEGGVGSHAFPSNLTRDASPFIHFDTPSAISFRETLPKPLQKLFDGYMGLGQTKWEMQTRNHNGHGEGNVSLVHNRSEDEVNHQIAELLKTKRMKILLEDDKPNSRENPYEKLFLEIIAKTVLNQKGESLGMKETLELAKFLGGSSTKETLQLVDYIQHKSAEGQAITLNDIALKLEAMKQTGHLDDRRLDWEMLKWEKQQETEANKWELLKDGIKAVTSGPIGETIKTIGAGAADRLRGKGRRLEPVKVDCPSCHKPIYADPNAQQVVCSSCGAVLEKKTEPQAEPQPQPEQPQPEATPQPSTEQPQEPEKQKLSESTEKEVIT